MPAKRQPARKRTTAARRTTSRGKHPAARVKVPRSGPIHAQIGARMVLFAISKLDTHGDTVQSRKDAAILRATHEGCPTCHGNGQVFTKGKDGSFTGSKPCPAKPTKQRVSKWAVYKASRFGVDKNTGLVGWACPCGKKEKPRYRDAKEATKALRTHERNKHGGKSVGGAWYAQATPGAIQTEPEQKATPAQKTAPKRTSRPKLPEVHAGNSPYDPNDPRMEHRRKPVSSNPHEKNQHSGLTDAEWITQDKDREALPGECQRCKGTSMVFALNADAKTDYDRQVVIPCPNTGCKGGRIAA